MQFTDLNDITHQIIINDTITGLTFSKLKNNRYSTAFNIHNPNIILHKIVNFDLIDLVYRLNPDIYEKISLTKIDDDNAVLILILKHFLTYQGLY